MMDGGSPLAPYFSFDARTWSSFNHSHSAMSLTDDEIEKCLAYNDRMPFDEVTNIYMPLSRLLHLYVRSRHERSSVIEQFLGKSLESAPFIISISGPVSAGKTTTAKLLKELISRWPDRPHVELITTDGYLYSNATLEALGIMNKKGFPISYDVRRLMTFLFQVKDGVPNLRVPSYSHLTYDVVRDADIIVDRPDILIIEGVNVLQNGADYPEIRNKVFISDLIDFSIYVDAREEYLITWYIDRFLKLRESTFDDPQSYFHRFAHLPEEEAVSLAQLTWHTVNHVNLVENILPCRNRASLVLQKASDHRISHIYLRK